MSTPSSSSSATGPATGPTPGHPGGAASGGHELAVDAVLVGGGPRAVAVVARLAARLTAAGEGGDDERATLRVAVVDGVEVGAGSTWRTDQSGLLLNNTEFSRTTAHADESTPMAGPVLPGPDLLSWARDAAADPSRPAWVAEELAGAAAEAFPTRRLQGVYYREQLVEAAQRAGIEVLAVTGTVVAVDADGGDRLTRLAPGARVGTLVGPTGPTGGTGTDGDGDGLVLRSSTVVLAQGMLQSRPDERTRHLVDAAERRGLVYVPPGMPAEQDWSRVPGGAEVLVAGLGANFFDVVALLTQGRGGRFVDDVTGEAVDVAGWPTDDGGAGGPAAGARLRYLPSGDEPRLLAGSPRGLPYRGKGAVADGGARPGHSCRLASDDWFAALAAHRGLDLHVDVWPTLLREMAVAHLLTVAEHHPDQLRRPLGEQEVVDLLAGERDPGTVLLEVHADPRHVPDLDRVDRAPRLHGDAWRAWVADWLEQEQASVADPTTSPRAAVNHAMATLRTKVALLVGTGAVEGASVLRDFHGWFNRMGLTLASGPPPRRTSQLLALVRAGVVELTGPDVRVELTEEGFAADTAGRGRVVTRAFAETRMSKGEVDTTHDPLLSGWLQSGRARLHRLPAAGGALTTRSLDVTVDGYHPVDVSGRVDPAVVVLGIPAETVQPGSAIGATPGVASPLLGGADLAADHVLRRRRGGDRVA